MLRWSLLFGLLTLMLGNAWAGELAGVRESYVREPIFGSKVFVREAGDARKHTVVLVHGLGDAASADWNKIISALATHYHVLTFDLPGFGRSEKGNHLYSPTRYAQFINWMLGRYTEWQDEEPVTMVGHSMGGGVALRHASLYPETLDRLVLVDAAGILHRSVFASSAVRVDAEGAGGILRVFSGEVDSLNQWMNDLIIGSESFPVPVDSVLTSSSMRRFVLRSNPSTIAALALLQEDFSEAIASVHTPTSIIWGENDTVAPVRTGRLLAARLAQSHFELIEGAAHVPMKQRPEAFKRVLLKELQRSHFSSPATVRGYARSRQAVCEDETDVRFSGSYRSISIKGCKRVTLDGVTTSNVEISDSDVEIVGGEIKTGDTGMRVQRSRVVATALDIRAGTGVEASASEIDFAGVDIRTNRAAVTSRDESRVMFSVSRVRSLYSVGSRHGVYKVTPESPL